MRIKTYQAAPAPQGRALQGLVLGLIGAAGCATGPALSGSAAEGAGSGKAVARLVSESYAVQSQSPSRWAAQLAAATAQLPKVAPRRLYHSADGSRYYAEPELAALPPAARANFLPETVDEEAYYYGPLGSPLFYMRLLDIVSENLRTNLPGRRLLEWHYSSIGPLKLLAMQGVQAVGISPSPRLRALYSFPGDQGNVPMVDREVQGRLSLLFGTFPAEPAARAAVGGDYDVILARNILTRGYLHPSAGAEAMPAADGPPPLAATARVQLGVTDEEFLRSLLAVLKPGGRLLIYNLCPPPPPADQAYDPNSDCRNPFPRSLWQALGFRVRDYDRSDTPAARSLLKALVSPGADESFATYTLVERP